MAKDLSIVPLLDIYGGALTDKQRNVMELYYNEDLSLSEIAEHEGITRQGVRDCVKRAEALLLEMEEQLKFAEFIRQTAHLCEDTAADCEALLDGRDKVSGYYSVQRVRRMLARQREFMDEHF